MKEGALPGVGCVTRQTRLGRCLGKATGLWKSQVWKDRLEERKQKAQVPFGPSGWRSCARWVHARRSIQRVNASPLSRIHLIQMPINLQD